MKRQYVFENRGDYLELIITGSYDFIDFMALPKVILSTCNKEKIYSLLISALEVTDADVSVLERFLFGNTIANILGNKIKIAALWPREHINHIAEKTANHAGARIFVSADRESALSWL